MRRAKIVCTLGPATNSPSQIEKLAEAGMNVARINRSHGSQEDDEVTIGNIRRVALQTGKAIEIGRASCRERV